MTLTIGRVLALVAAGFFILALALTNGWLDGEGNARDVAALFGFICSALALAVD